MKLELVAPEGETRRELIESELFEDFLYKMIGDRHLDTVELAKLLLGKDKFSKLIVDAILEYNAVAISVAIDERESQNKTKWEHDKRELKKEKDALTTTMLALINETLKHKTLDMHRIKKLAENRDKESELLRTGAGAYKRNG